MHDKKKTLTINIIIQFIKLQTTSSEVDYLCFLYRYLILLLPRTSDHSIIEISYLMTSCSARRQLAAIMCVSLKWSPMNSEWSTLNKDRMTYATYSQKASDKFTICRKTARNFLSSLHQPMNLITYKYFNKCTTSTEGELPRHNT